MDDPNETSLSDLQKAAARAGCTIQWVTNDDGVRMARVESPSGWHSARLLVELCKTDEGKPALGEAARILRQGVEHDDAAYAKRVQDFVRRNVQFQREVGEIFQGPTYTTIEGFGDCDDHARLVRGLLHAGGVPSALGFLSPPGGDPRHVTTIAHTPRPTWVETTCDARYGEHPLVAARRLGILNNRQDLSNAKVTIMSGDHDDDDFVPPGVLVPLTPRAEPAGFGATPPAGMAAVTIVATRDLPDEFFSKGVAIAARHGWSFEDMLAVMLNESNVRPTAVNPNGGATGLIQFMPNIAAGLLGGTPTEAQQRLVRMSAVDQLDLVERFFKPYEQFGLHSPGRFYQATFLPATLKFGSSPDTILTGTRAGDPFPFAYGPNRGFDRDRKGFITIQDLETAIQLAQKRSAQRWAELQARTRDAGGGGSGLLGPGVGNATAWTLILGAAAGITHYIDPGFLPGLFRSAKRWSLRYI